MDISAAATANIAEKDGEISLKGYADVTGETADETFNSLIGGNKAFTIEAVFNPNNVGYNGADYNMIASKGDSSAAFRVSEQTVYFFIKNTNGSSLRWKQYFCLCRRKRNGNHTECGKRSYNDLSAWYRILSGDKTSFFRISEEHPRLLSSTEQR